MFYGSHFDSDPSVLVMIKSDDFTGVFCDVRRKKSLRILDLHTMTVVLLKSE